ncbi:MAG TPA: hypothetical protein VLE49_19115, partial [Anaerolineales bacterium]|nr:hypothetical protein [Anaerolineales bacterium]
DNYSLNNVFVFDFYNILTGPDGHHRYNNGQVEYSLSGRNTLYYPSGDDHPSEAGSQKATQEFVPMLNIFYHRWKQNAPAQSAPVATSASQPESQPGTSSGSSWIDDFDANSLPKASGWEGFRDEATATTLTCEVGQGTGRAGNSLHFDFDIAANSWGTCATSFETPQSWNAGDMLTFTFRTSRGGLLFDVDLYTGSAENRATYVFTIEAPAAGAANWVPMEINLDAFQRASWEENAGASLTPSDKIAGMAFGATTPQDTPNAGELWVDDLQVSGAGVVDQQPGVEPTTAPLDSQPDQSEQGQPERGPSLPCTGGILLPLLFLGFLQSNGRKR